ncbi:MAG: hypothetical protein MHPSP_004008, partial [Paramarteilia canceri]
MIQETANLLVKRIILELSPNSLKYGPWQLMLSFCTGILTSPLSALRDFRMCS